MHFDRGESCELERVADRVGVVGPGTRIENDAVRHPLEPMQVLDEVALVVGLKEARRQAELASVVRDRALEFGERRPAVLLGVPPPDLIEVGAVHHLDPVSGVRAHSPANSLTAASTSRSGTGEPVFGNPGRSSSTNGTGPSPTRLLSVRVACTTARGSAPSIVVGR